MYTVTNTEYEIIKAKIKNVNKVSKCIPFKTSRVDSMLVGKYFKYKYDISIVISKGKINEYLFLIDRPPIVFNLIISILRKNKNGRKNKYPASRHTS